MELHDLFLDDGSFAAPRYVKDIALVPETHRDWYRAIARGGYELKHHIWRGVRQPFEAAFKQAQSDGQAKIDKVQAALDRAIKRLDNEHVDRLLSDALDAAGVSKGLISGAVALMRINMSFEIEDDAYGGGRVVVGTTPDGFLLSPQGAVERFLESDEGTAFKGRSPAPNDAYFSGLVDELKRKR